MPTPQPQSFQNFTVYFFPWSSDEQFSQALNKYTKRIYTKINIYKKKYNKKINKYIQNIQIKYTKKIVHKKKVKHGSSTIYSQIIRYDSLIFLPIAVLKLKPAFGVYPSIHL